MSALRADELFVFAGAGVSLSAPACLPMFNWLRDEILHQLGLDAYCEGARGADASKVEVAAGLAPEPFMLDLRLGGVALESWLEQVLDGEPNAAHHALAALARAGARVWTVNFDRLIERAAPGLRVLAWPEPPDRPADVVKPHGTLGRELIIGADQVLRGLAADWARRLREDVHGRVVVFLGYSGRDLDFQPLWDSVLADARRVVWFDQPEPRDPKRVVDEARRRLLLRDTEARGALEFRVAGAPPPQAPAAARPNSAADFVRWCEDQSLLHADRALLVTMYQRVHVTYPALPGELAWSRAAMLGHLGDTTASRLELRALLRKRGSRARAARALLNSSITNGDMLGRAVLRATRVLPPVGRLQTVRERAERKRLTALHREAQHERVLRATRHFDGSSVSTLLILRATALRWLGSLDDAVALADEAFARARREEHAVRTAHAAFQKAIALLWAQRVDECSRCLEDELRPFASLAANRWVAWSHFIAGGLAVRAGQPDAALRAFELGETLFRAEALMDGVVSIRLARLTALRLAEQDDVFRGHANELRSQQALDDGRDWRWYARSSNISVLALHLEEGEFARGREHDRVTAQRHFGVVASTRYPLYKSLGQLGLALSVSSPIERSRWTQAARATAGDIGARLVEARATEILAGKATADRPVFFC